MPGEIITQDAIDYLREVLSLGGVITGCSDDSLRTVQVILWSHKIYLISRRDAEAQRD